MTKTEIELLMRRDVDEVSDLAVHLSRKQLGITLKNATALLSREDPPNHVEERLFLFKLLRFVQAALAGGHEYVSLGTASEVITSVQLVLKRNVAPHVNRAARDVLSVLTTKRVQLEGNQVEVIDNSLALHGRAASKEPFKFKNLGTRDAALEMEQRRTARSSKPDAAGAKAASKPKALPH